MQITINEPVPPAVRMPQALQALPVPRVLLAVRVPLLAVVLVARGVAALHQHLPPSPCVPSHPTVVSRPDLSQALKMS